MRRNPKDIFFVSIQFLLFAAYLFRIAEIDFAIIFWLRLLGLFFAVIGMGIVLLSLRTLSRSLSVFPTPKQTATLIQSGIYQYIRHPIYTGILVFAIGYSFYSQNTWRLLISFALFLLFARKATYEEKLLQKKFDDYGSYKKKTGMFLPGV